MELLPREKDKLLLFTAGLVAERRLNRGGEIKLPRSGCLHQLCDLRGGS